MRDLYARQRRQFIAETRDHQMTVLHDDGLYRHLRFQAPGTGIWHWDLITWPGSLAIRGDIGQGHVFTRVDDMLQFFDHGQHEHQINAHYWAEKLDLGRDSVKGFNTDRFVEWCAENAPDVEESDAMVDHEHAALEILEEREIEFDWEDIESWRDYEHHFLIALYAILWGAKTYHAAKAAEQKESHA